MFQPSGLTPGPGREVRPLFGLVDAPPQTSAGGCPGTPDRRTHQPPAHAGTAATPGGSATHQNEEPAETPRGVEDIGRRSAGGHHIRGWHRAAPRGRTVLVEGFPSGGSIVTGRVRCATPRTACALPVLTNCAARPYGFRQAENFAPVHGVSGVATPTAQAGQISHRPEGQNKSRGTHQHRPTTGSPKQAPHVSQEEQP